MGSGRAWEPEVGQGKDQDQTPRVNDHVPNIQRTPSSMYPAAFLQLSGKGSVVSGVMLEHKDLIGEDGCALWHCMFVLAKTWLRRTGG